MHKWTERWVSERVWDQQNWKPKGFFLEFSPGKMDTNLCWEGPWKKLTLDSAVWFEFILRLPTFEESNRADPTWRDSFPLWIGLFQHLCTKFISGRLSVLSGSLLLGHWTCVRGENCLQNLNVLYSTPFVSFTGKNSQIWWRVRRSFWEEGKPNTNFVGQLFVDDVSLSQTPLQNSAELSKFRNVNALESEKIGKTMKLRFLMTHPPPSKAVWNFISPHIFVWKTMDSCDRNLERRIFRLYAWTTVLVLADFGIISTFAQNFDGSSVLIGKNSTSKFDGKYRYFDFGALRSCETLKINSNLFFCWKWENWPIFGNEINLIS